MTNKQKKLQENCIWAIRACTFYNTTVVTAAAVTVNATVIAPVFDTAVYVTADFCNSCCCCYYYYYYCSAAAADDDELKPADLLYT